MQIEKAWITNIACTKPKDIGYAEELWTYRSLQKYIRKHCTDAGYPGLSQISPNTVRTILENNEIKPNKITYYLERRDPDFESKMHEVLVVYKQVSLCFDEAGNLIIPMDASKTVTISYDEKPGIQALRNIDPDLPPTAEHDTLRLVLDNHSAHTSKETQKYLATKPGRFEFVFTPKHGSWLNLIESFLGKMAKQCLKGIRVNSKQELEERIYKYIEEINAEPVVYHWTYKMEDVSV